MTAYMVVTGPGFIAPDGTAQTWHFEGTGFDTLGTLTGVVFSAVAAYGTLTLHFPLPGQTTTDTGDVGVLTFSGATGTLSHFEVDVTTSGSGGSWWWTSSQVGEFVNFNAFDYTFTSDPGIGDTDLIVSTPDSNAYSLTPVTGAYVDVAWIGDILPLDATHSLMWSRLPTGALTGWRMRVVEHSNPLAPTVGSVLTINITATSNDGAGPVMMGDDLTVMFTANYDPTATGVPPVDINTNWSWFFAVWDGNMTMTAGSTGARTFETWVYALAVTDRHRLLTVGTDHSAHSKVYLFNFDETGFTSLLDSDVDLTSPWTGTPLFGVVSTTQVLGRTNLGVLRVIDVTSDNITFPVDRDLSTDIDGTDNANGILLQQETTDPTKFRGYSATFDGSRYWYWMQEYQVTSAPAINLLSSLRILDATGLAGFGYAIDFDVDGLTSLGVDDNDHMVVAAEANALSGWTVDYRHRRNAAGSGTNTFAGNVRRNIGDGLVLAPVQRTTPSATIRVEVWQIVTVPPTPPFFAPVTDMWDVQIITGRR